MRCDNKNYCEKKCKKQKKNGKDKYRYQDTQNSIFLLFSGYFIDIIQNLLKTHTIYQDIRIENKQIVSRLNN